MCRAILRRRAAALLAVLALVTAACSGGSNGSPTSAPDNGIGAQNPTLILAHARAAMRAAGSMHVTGSATRGAQRFHVDITVDTKRTRSRGTLTVNGIAITFVTVHRRAYIKAPPRFYAGFGVPRVAAARTAGRWLRVSLSNPVFAELGRFADPRALVTPLGAVRKGGETLETGKPAISVTDRLGTIYVRTVGKPYPVKFVGAGPARVTLTFSRFGTAGAVTVPQRTYPISVLRG